jgi:hypothetical protein
LRLEDARRPLSRGDHIGAAPVAGNLKLDRPSCVLGRACDRVLEPVVLGGLLDVEPESAAPFSLAGVVSERDERFVGFVAGVEAHVHAASAAAADEGDGPVGVETESFCGVDVAQVYQFARQRRGPHQRRSLS